MKFKSSILSQASGSVGGSTYSRNKGGMYIRARAIPINPATPQQEEVRSYFGQLASLWVNTLSAAQRAAWDLYADNVTLINSLGEPIHINGQSHYIRSNVPRLQGSIARQDTAPGVFDLGDFTQPTFTVDAAADDVDVAFTNTDAWATEVGGAMYVFASRPQNLTINFFKGPYRFAGKIAGAVVPPTSPATFTLPFSMIPGQRVFFKVMTGRADGRLSLFFRDFDDA